MFEYHGWATLRVDDLDEFGDEGDEVAERDFVVKLRHHITSLPLNAAIHIQERNLLCAFHIFGHHNHRQEPVIDLFRWIAQNARRSYGLLYIHDDEDFKRGGDFSNEFRVWKMAFGMVEEMSDPFLSPYMPTVEFPYEDKP